MTAETTENKAPRIEVCHGPQCSDVGGRDLSAELEAQGMRTCVGDCRSQCPNAPLVLVDNRMVTQATIEKVQTKVNDLYKRND